MIQIIQQYGLAYLGWDGYHISGLVMTLWLLVLSCAIGFCLALPLAIARNARSPFIWFPVWLFTFIFRGTPLYVQLLLIYSGIYGLEFVHATAPFNAFFRDALNCTILSFALNTGAYTTEIFAGAIKETSHGEVDAALAMGMSRVTLYRRIVIPSALRRALPVYSNEVILICTPPLWPSPPRCRISSKWPMMPIPPLMTRSTVFPWRRLSICACPSR
jgi:histidine transport system permease protein